MNEILINNLNYGNILRNLNLVIKNNSFNILSGPNNSGKTTLLRILNREIITDNQIIIDNKSIIDYKINEFENIIQCVIPTEIVFQEKTVFEELHLIENLDSLEDIVKGLKIGKILNKQIEYLKVKDLIRVQLAMALLKKPLVLLIDSITPFFEKKELKEILLFLKLYQEKYSLTVIYCTLNLTESLIGDYLFIISNGCIALEGKPIKVLENDNIINKIGLDIPFMIDLSVKLKDYELISNIELEVERMVDTLWN